MRIEKDSRHRYYLDGERIKASVTGVIGLLDKSPQLMGWAAKMTAEYFLDILPLIVSGKLKISAADIPELCKLAKANYKKKQKEACDIGTEVHAAIENYELRQEMPLALSAAAQNAFTGYLEWRGKVKLGKIICAELMLVNKLDEGNYCGQLDKVQYYNEKVYLIDYKTSKAFYNDSMAIQLAAYWKAYEYSAEKVYPDMKLPEIQGMGILRLDKETGLPDFKDYTSCKEQAWSMFQNLFAVFYGKKELNEVLKNEMSNKKAGELRGR